MRLLIGGPARQDVETFREHLKAINALVLPEGVELFKHYVINDCSEIMPLLNDGEYEVINTGDVYTVTEKTHEWRENNLQKMCKLRNAMLKECLRGNYDGVVFVDTDVIVHPDTIKWLLASGKDIIAEIFWTEDQRGGIWSNCWSYDQTGYDLREVESWMKPGVYRVGGTGACMLIRRNVIESKVSYAPLYNIRKALVGEDRYFMLRAACAGYELFIDTHCPAQHLYRPSELKKYMEEKYGDS